MQLDIFIHSHENNAESQAHLDANKKHFTKQAIDVYEWLKSGKTLTGNEARDFLDIQHLPRRIADLRAGGINIQDRWIGNGHKRVKSYYIQQP